MVKGALLSLFLFLCVAGCATTNQQEVSSLDPEQEVLVKLGQEKKRSVMLRLEELTMLHQGNRIDDTTYIQQKNILIKEWEDYQTLIMVEALSY